MPLQFSDNQFSVVVTRFSFHHFMDYEKVFDEMIRVCKPNGSIMVVDVVLPTDKANNYDQMEKLRDSSHVAALTVEKFDVLFQNQKLKECSKYYYEMAIELETQINASYLSDAEKEELKSMVIQDIGINNLGVNVNSIDGKYYLHYPICIYVGKKV
jgi:ubiquinone/menaquinone biosynthesis C-methylase UbiE